MEYSEILEEIRSQFNEKNVKGMARFGIVPKNAYGLSASKLKSIKKKTGKNHELAQKLWNTDIHDTKLLAFLIDNPVEVTEAQMDDWVSDFYSWDLCDGCCIHLFRKTPYAYKKISEWYKSDEEFVKRAAFVLIATLAVHDKKADDEIFLRFLPKIKEASLDERNFVKKAVNWALRQIGKRNRYLNKEAVRLAEEIKQFDSKSAKWTANDALRELRSEKVQVRLR